MFLCITVYSAIYILGSKLEVDMSDKKVSSSIGKLHHNVTKDHNYSNNHKQI